MYRTRFFQPLAIAGALATAVCSLARAAETRMLPLTPTIWEYRMANFAENSEEQTVAMLNRLGRGGLGTRLVDRRFQSSAAIGDWSL